MPTIRSGGPRAVTPLATPAEEKTAAALGGDRIATDAVHRIVGERADPAGPLMGRGPGKRLKVAEIDGKSLELSSSGRLMLGGKLAGPGPGRGADATLTYTLAKQAADTKDGLFSTLSLSSAMRGRIVAQLSEALDFAQSGKRSVHKQKAFAGAMTLLIDLARSTPKSDTVVRRAALDLALKVLGREQDIEILGFYLQSMRDLITKLDKVQYRALKSTLARVLPVKPPVEAWTENRTKPLEIRHSIHHEFWKEELSLFTKKNGWTLTKKNADDTRREYVGKLKDPDGAKKDLEVHIVVRKGELDFLDGIDDPKAHLIMYSGHSALGGNGSESIQVAGEMKGPHPKLVFIANCRGKDNYAEFTNKFPEAHVIMTEHHTYSVSGQDRIVGLFDMLARGATYRHMRDLTEKKWWDEPADNYFYPDQWKKFRFMDSDDDGKVDFSGLGSDRLFDVDLRAAGAKFVRGVNFANSEVHYHWEVDKANKVKSFFGKEYGDSLLPDGPLTDAKPGEVVRVEAVERKLANGKKATRFLVKYEPALAAKTDENVYAGLVTKAAVEALAVHKLGELPKREKLRAALMGAHAIHYLDVYVDTSPKSTKAYFERIGLGPVDAKDVDKVFNAFDAHANDAQVAAFEKMLVEKYGVDVEAWAA